jgi:hypothetical protein
LNSRRTAAFISSSPVRSEVDAGSDGPPFLEAISHVLTARMKNSTALSTRSVSL